jgi:DNA helicase II / ATP-dependent DNA helicase PcrA
MTTHDTYLKDYERLNPEQKRAVDTIDGPLMVIAGPGTGKTQVLALRVGNILRQTDTRPGNILCLTFTDAASINMKERLSRLIGAEGYKVAIHTFHSFASDIISKYPEHFYSGADFLPADKLRQIEALEEAFGELPRSSALASIHENNYTYLTDTQKAIANLKKAGISPDAFVRILKHNAAELKRINPLLDGVFRERLGKGSIEAVAQVAQVLADTQGGPIEGYHPLSHATARSLALALEEARDEDKTAPLSAWKEKWVKKGELEDRVHKDTIYLEKLADLATIYKRYREILYTTKYYDFDDMLLDVVEELSHNPVLLAELEERYQYIMVDEFQDTNDAQLRLVRFLGSAPVNEGKPNIMIVGDDDQAIFRFQGAEISNILDFPKYFAAHELVVLTKNYRSTQQILDVAREVIEKSEERLEKVIPKLEKKLIASRTELGHGNIVHMMLPTRLHEHAYIMQEITRLIADGHDPSEIAVITRKHAALEDLARTLVRAGIPINYERKQNVLEEPHVRLLVTMARFVASLVRRDMDVSENFLPTILSAPCFNIDRETLWSIATTAQTSPGRSWIAAMKTHHDPKVVAIAEWFIRLGADSHHDPLERILDELIGSDGAVRQATGQDDDHDVSSFALPPSHKKRTYQSPFRSHYFGEDVRKNEEAKYLLFLSSLGVFMGALRAWKNGTTLYINDIEEFIALHERHKISLADETPFVSAGKAVHLMTAHKSKGLEFETVFVASCQDDVWNGGGFANKLPMPMNLPLDTKDEGDERLRIFYVALTRAKRHLYLTAYRKSDAGKDSLKVAYILPETDQGALATHLYEQETVMSPDSLTHRTFMDHSLPRDWQVTVGERAILEAKVKDLRLSVTHLNNFLNVTEGGPKFFLEQNLLAFPQAKSPYSMYGSAMHKAIERYLAQFRRTKELPSSEILVQFFEECMERGRFTKAEYLHFLHAGQSALPLWWERRGRHLTSQDGSEIDFKKEGVVVAGVPLTGKIDHLTEHQGIILVTDWKTGKAKTDWKGKDKNEAITLANYRRQLAFYKLLVEHSHTYHDKKVEQGVLEFIEPVNDEIVTLVLDITDEEVAHLTDLIGAVHARIVALDFPDISMYPQTLDGIEAFEADLIRDWKANL